VLSSASGRVSRPAKLELHTSGQDTEINMLLGLIVRIGNAPWLCNPQYLILEYGADPVLVVWRYDPTNAPRRRRIGFQFGNPAIDRAPRDTRRLARLHRPLQGRRRAPQPPRRVAVLVRREPDNISVYRFRMAWITSKGRFIPGF
jgi:hypothetical protein